MTPTVRTEGAADGLREAVARALRNAPDADPHAENLWMIDADAAIAAVRAYDAANRPAIRITLPDGFTHVGSNDAPPPAQDVSVSPQPVPVVATGSDELRKAVTACIRHAAICRGMADGDFLPLTIAALGAVERSGWLAPDPMTLAGCDHDWQAIDNTTAYCAKCALTHKHPVPGAPAAQATVPAGGVERLASDIAHLTFGVNVDPDWIAAELTRLGYGLGGGLSDGARQALLMLVDIYDGRVLDRDRLASARAEIEAMARVGVRT